MSISKKLTHIRSGPSGEHPVVKFARKKLDSINENELAAFQQLNERLAKVTTPAPKDPRREPSDDERVDSSPPVDFVGPIPQFNAITVEPDPFPSKPPPHGDDEDE